MDSSVSADEMRRCSIRQGMRGTTGEIKRMENLVKLEVAVFSKLINTLTETSDLVLPH